MSGQFTMSMVLRLVDQFSATGAKAMRTLDQIGQAGQRAARKASNSFARGLIPQLDDAAIDKMVSKAERRVQAARGRLMDAFALGTSLAAPVLNYATSEHRLAHLGNVGDMTAEQLEKVGAKLRTNGAIVNQTLKEMIEGYDYLLGKGMDGDLHGITKETGKSATATGADIKELAATAYAATDNLGIAAERIKKVFDMAAKGGKEGGFELKDMAKHFPGLTAKAKMLGMEGEAAFAKLTAALQIAVKGAANPDEAANNFQNFLAKIASPETVRAFKKKGINLRKELDKAMANGVDPMEYLLVRISDLAKDNKWITSDLFGDMQVQNFLNPILKQLDEYRRIRDEVMKADGVIDADYDRVMNTIVERWKAFVIELSNANAASGGLAETIKGGLVAATKLVATFNKFAANHPELTENIVKSVAAILAMGVATRVLGYAWALTGGAAAGALKTLWKFKPVGKLIAGLSSGIAKLGKGLGQIGFNGLLKLLGKSASLRRFTAMLLLVGRTGGAIMALKALASGAFAAIVAAGWPLFAVIAAIAGAAALIYKYWQPLEAFFSGLFEGLAEAGGSAASEIADMWRNAFSSVEGLVGKIAEKFGGDAEAAMAAFRSVFDFSWLGEQLETAKQAVSGFLSDLFTPVELTDEQLFETSQLGKSIGKKIGELLVFIPKELAKIAPALIDIGAQWASGLIDGFKSKWGEFTQWLSDKASKLKFWGDDTKPKPGDEPTVPPASPPAPPQVPAYKPLPAQQQPTNGDMNGVLGNISSLISKIEAGSQQPQQVQQDIDQSKHVNQTNHWSITIQNNGPAMLAGAVKSTVSNANSQALRDTD